MESDDEDKSVIGAARPRDAEEDVFDVAHNSMLRTAAELPMTGRRHAVATADWDGCSYGVAALALQATGGAGETATTAEFAMTVTGSSADEEHLRNSIVQSAIEATWAKANALQDQAIAGATRAAFTEARRAFEIEKAEATRRLEEELRLEAEKANERLWKVAAHEREAAVRAALADQGAELQRVKKELADQQQKAAEELEEAYKSLKAEVSRVLEDQHAANVNAAVQSAWERAGRLQESAVTAAQQEARAEAEAKAEERMKLERLQLGSDMRNTLQNGVSANAEELLASRSEVVELRKQLDVARVTARDAEANAAKSTQTAVKDAMKAMEAVQKASVDRAVARALAKAGIVGAAPDSTDVS